MKIWILMITFLINKKCKYKIFLEKKIIILKKIKIFGRMIQKMINTKFMKRQIKLKNSCLNNKNNDYKFLIQFFKI